MFTKLEGVAQILIDVGAALFGLLTNSMSTVVSVVMGKLEGGLQKLTVSLAVSLVTRKLKSGLIVESLMMGAGSCMR